MLPGIVGKPSVEGKTPELPRVKNVQCQECSVEVGASVSYFSGVL
jgi:hypothetical protein